MKSISNFVLTLVILGSLVIGSTIPLIVDAVGNQPTKIDTNENAPIVVNVTVTCGCVACPTLKPVTNTVTKVVVKEVVKEVVIDGGDNIEIKNIKINYHPNIHNKTDNKVNNHNKNK